MSTAEYFCSLSGSGPFFSLKNPVGLNISLDDSIMQAGGARHQYRTPLLPSPNPFTDAELFSGEEIVLGILSLFIISLISSLVYDILLRSGYNKAYSTRAISIAAALESVERWGFHLMPFIGTKEAEQDETRRSGLWFKGIFIVIFLAGATFSLEVLLVAATQEIDVATNGKEIGFMVTSPVVTHWGMGQFLRRNAPTRPCVTPSISGGNVEWKARVQTCFNVNFTDSVPRNVRYSGRMRYRSVYHRRGCDHFLSALDGGPTYALSVRVKIYRSDVGPAEVLRSPMEQEEEKTALLVHLTAPIYYATNLVRSESKTCGNMQIPPITYTHKVTKEQVTVGQSENDLVVEDGTVYSTEFVIDVDDIEWWIVQGLGSAAASAGISLTDSPRYLTGRTAELTDIEDEMYVTKRRRFAAPTMGVVLAFLLIFKLLVKKFLKPLSLFEIARIKALEAAGINPNTGMRDERGCVRIDMNRNNQGLSALYSGPADDITQRDDLTYEEARNYYVNTAKH